jgi:hypothetical protein
VTGHGTILVRYGNSVKAHKEALIQQLFRSAAARVWPTQRFESKVIASDKEALLKQQRQISSTGTCSGYVARPFHDPTAYPALADDPSNVRFVRL